MKPPSAQKGSCVSKDRDMGEGLQRKLSKSLIRGSQTPSPAPPVLHNLRPAPHLPQEATQHDLDGTPAQVSAGTSRCHADNLVLYGGASSPSFRGLPGHWLPGQDSTCPTLQEVSPHGPQPAPQRTQAPSGQPFVCVCLTIQ